MDVSAPSRGATAPASGAQTSRQQGTKRRMFLRGTRETKEEHGHAILLSSPLFGVSKRTSRRFHWTVETVADLHFNSLQIYGWTSLSRHKKTKQKKKAYFNSLLCIRLFVRCWKYPLYFNIGRTVILQLCPLLHVSSSSFLIFAFRFVLGLVNKAVNFKDATRNIRGTNPSLCWHAGFLFIPHPSPLG